MASLPNDPNLLNKCLKNQCKATQEVKDQYDKILRQKEQHVQVSILFFQIHIGYSQLENEFCYSF